MLMRMMVFCLLLITMALWSGCAVRGKSSAQQAQVLYYDINHDQLVDLETHSYTGKADANWELRDDDHNGRYEKKITFGFAVTRSVVDLPVPTGVHIDRKISFDDPAVGYFRAYSLLKNAEKTSNQKESRRLLDESGAYLQEVKNRFPDWKHSLVEARIQQNNELRAKLSANKH